MITDQENKILDTTAKLWNQILELPLGHPDDIIDTKFHIHAIQNIILSRSGAREVNNTVMPPKAEKDERSVATMNHIDQMPGQLK